MTLVEFTSTSGLRILVNPEQVVFVETEDGDTCIDLTNGRKRYVKEDLALVKQRLEASQPGPNAGSRTRPEDRG